MSVNPVTKADFPDPDIIRVGDSYFMVCTTMYFMPGAVILRSFDLINWEIYSHVYQTLDNTPAQKLEGNLNVYGKGMWAASLRHYNGEFFVCFVANDTQKTYLYRSEDLKGPWKKSFIEGFYHDCSLLFDDDRRVYIVYGNREIYLTELKSDLSGPKKGGLHRMILKDGEEAMLGYEGAHFYKINGRYYLFLIHWYREKTQRRVEACFTAASLEEEFLGGDVLDDNLDFFNSGVAQGGIVDTPDGDWYAVLFQDRGAVGRIPVVVPVSWENDFPVFGIDGRVPVNPVIKSTRPDHVYSPLVSSDDFRYGPETEKELFPAAFWQWNHTPDSSLWNIDGDNGVFSVTSGKVAENVTKAQNVLTQLTVIPGCEAEIEVDGSRLNDGDYAGICALQGRYGMIALTRDSGEFYIVMKGRPGKPVYPPEALPDYEPGEEYERIRLGKSRVRLKIALDFDNMKDEAEFYYLKEGNWEKAGINQKLYFGLDHFTGCRIGLFLYSTEETGGTAGFRDFIYRKKS